jgi:bacteriorhodopsin
MRTNIPKIRHILNLETCISVVAAFFYSQFMKRLEQSGDNINYKQINETRYTDWAITTPIMLLVLVLAILYNTGGSLNFFDFLIILLFNYVMLASGYLGEIGKITKRQGVIIGFIGFVLLYGFIYAKYMTGKYIFDNQMIFWAFVILWAIYGLIYEADEEKRNVGYNILDLFSKCFVGIFFWAYFTKTFTLK